MLESVPPASVTPLLDARAGVGDDLLRQPLAGVDAEDGFAEAIPDKDLVPERPHGDELGRTPLLATPDRDFKRCPVPFDANAVSRGHPQADAVFPAQEV